MFISDNEKYFEIVDEFINHCKNNFDENYEKCGKYIGKVNLLKQYCTLNFNLSRQCGKTCFAIKLLEKYDSNLFGRKQIVTNNLKQLVKLKMINPNYPENNWNYEIKNKNKIKDIFNIRSELRGYNFKDILIVDDFNYIPKSILENFYETISPTNVKCIIGIG